MPLNAFAARRPVAPVHTVSFGTLTVGFGKFTNAPDPDPVQPLLSVTVTEYVPTVLVLIELVVAPLLQAYVYGPVPPDALAFNGPVAPVHTVSLATVTVGFGKFTNAPEPDPVQPLLSVTVTEYVPTVLVLIELVVAPVLHAYVYGPVPPDALAFNGPVAPVHTVSLATVTVGLGRFTSMPEADPVQPLLSVTVTEYVPGVLVLIELVVAPVLHAYVYGLVPPDTFAFNGPVAPTHTVSFGTLTVGFAKFARHPEPEPVQPLLSVTVTE